MQKYEFPNAFIYKLINNISRLNSIDKMNVNEEIFICYWDNWMMNSIVYATTTRTTTGFSEAVVIDNV